MPTGCPITFKQRNDIADLFYLENASALEIWRRIFGANPSVVKLETVESICRKLNVCTSEELRDWLSPEQHKKTGRPRFFDTPDMSDSLLAIMRQRCSVKLETLRNEFIKIIFGEEEAPLAPYRVSVSTIDRELHRNDWTRKVLCIKSIHRVGSQHFAASLWSWQIRASASLLSVFSPN